MAMVLRSSRLRLTQAIYFGDPIGGSGTGTVTSITQDNGILATPNPITGAGTIGFGLLTSDHSLGNFNLDMRNSVRWVNVVTCGADPTGVADSAAAFTAALALLSVSGGAVYVPAGTYKILSTITVNKQVRWYGDGGQSFIKLPDASDGFNITQSFDGPHIFDGLTFATASGAVATAGAFIHGNAAANQFELHVSQCYFVNHFVGVQMNSNNFSSIRENVFLAFGAVAGSADVWVDNLVAPDTGDNLITGNVFGGTATYSIRQTAGGGTKITSNKFLGAGSYHFALDIPNGKNTSDLFISGNSFENAPTLAGIGLIHAGGWANFTITGNQFTFTNTTTHILVQPAATGYAARGVITDNLFYSQFPNTAINFQPAGAGLASAWYVGGNLFGNSLVGIQLPAAPGNLTFLDVGQNQFIGGTYVAGTFDPTSGFGPGVFTKAGFNTVSPTREVDINGTLRSRGIAAPAVSEANSGTIYFDSGLNKFRVSLNGGAYVDLVGSAGLTGTGVAGHLPYWSSATNLLNATALYVDAVNNRLGLNVPAPGYRLDMDGDLNFSTTSVARVGGQRFLAHSDANATTILGTDISTTLAVNSVAVGKSAMRVATALAVGSTGLGTSAGAGITDGNHNTAIGSGTLAVTTTGNNNTALGNAAGLTNTTGSNNVFLGQAADASAGNLTNAVAIGYQASVASSDSMVLGNGTMNVGIRTSTPVLPLDVNGAIGTRHHDVALVNGLNSNVVPTLTSWIRVTGPTAPFSIGGFTSGVDGRIMFIRNTTAFQMTINHLDGGSAAANQIVTPTAAPINCSVATLIYEDAQDVWVVQSYF